MHLLLTDETNSTATAAVKFFVYGGLIVDMARLPELHDRIAAIRTEHGYRPGDTLKFDTRARPEHVPLERCTAAKSAVIEACTELGCKFIAYVILHAIARARPAEEVVAWGASHVVGRFNYFLQLSGSYGMVAVDRFPHGNDYSFLTDKFCFGLTFPDDEPVLLDRIKLFSSTCINASHASSAMDVVLGAFRYCINEPANIPAARQMMAQVVRLMWHVREGEQIHALERGLVFRPKVRRVAAYEREYMGLIDGINELLREEPGAR